MFTLNIKDTSVTHRRDCGNPDHHLPTRMQISCSHSEQTGLSLTKYYYGDKTRMRWDGHSACTDGMRNATTNFILNPQQK